MQNVKFCSLQGKNVQFFLIFNFNQGKIILILPITWGDTCIPSLHWELPPPHRRKCSNEILPGIDLQILFMVE